MVYMKNFFLLFGFMIQWGAVSLAQENSQLELNITGFDCDSGKVLIGVYDEKGKWLKDASYGKKEKIHHGKVRVIFDDLPEGTYGISCFHDKNDNGKLDTSFLGFPTEPYACSRGARGRFGPPKWEDALFTLKGNTQIKIEL